MIFFRLVKEEWCRIKYIQRRFVLTPEIQKTLIETPASTVKYNQKPPF